MSLVWIELIWSHESFNLQMTGFITYLQANTNTQFPQHLDN